MERYPFMLDDFAFNPVPGTDIVDLPPPLAQFGHDRQIGRHMAGGPSAGEDDFVHMRNSPRISGNIKQYADGGQHQC